MEMMVNMRRMRANAEARMPGRTPLRCRRQNMRAAAPAQPTVVRRRVSIPPPSPSRHVQFIIVPNARAHDLNHACNTTPKTQNARASACSNRNRPPPSARPCLGISHVAYCSPVVTVRKPSQNVAGSILPDGRVPETQTPCCSFRPFERAV